MTSWSVRCLGEIADESDGEIRTGPFGSQLHRQDYTDSSDGVPVIMPVNMVAGRVDFRGIARVSQTKASEMAAHITQKRDVLLARRGDIGRYCLIDSATEGALCGTGSLRISIQGSTSLLPEYLCYYLETPVGLHELQGKAIGATMPNLNSSIVRSVGLPVPPLEIQRKIIAILSTYDNLIKNNNRRILLLEETAQRIYHEWFVEFRYPRHEHVPLVESKVGKVPDGWISRSLREVVGHHIGGGWGADESSHSDNRPARVIRGTDIPRVRRGDISTCPLRYHSAANLRSRLLQEGDIVFEVSGGSKGQPVGRSVLISSSLLRELAGDAICASFCKLVRADRNVLSPELLNYRFLQAYASGEIDSYQVQSTGITNLRFSQLLDTFPVLVPPASIQSAFADFIDPILSGASLLGIQIRNLAASRNFLLPRLISGEIDVTKLNIALSEVAA